MKKTICLLFNILLLFLSGCGSPPYQSIASNGNIPDTVTPSTPTSTPTLPVSGDSCVSEEFKREIGTVKTVIDCGQLDVMVNGEESVIALLGLGCPQGSNFDSLQSYLSQVFVGKQVLIVYDEKWNEQIQEENEAVVPGVYVFMNDVLVNRWLIESMYFGFPVQGQYGCSDDFLTAYYSSFARYYSTQSANQIPQIVLPRIPTFDINSVVECHTITLIGAGGVPYTATDCNFK